MECAKLAEGCSFTLKYDGLLIFAPPLVIQPFLHVDLVLPSQKEKLSQLVKYPGVCAGRLDLPEREAFI